METDIDRLAWDHELFTHVPEIVDGHLIMPDRRGWGTEPNEEGLRAYLPKNKGGHRITAEEAGGFVGRAKRSVPLFLTTRVDTRWAWRYAPLPTYVLCVTASRHAPGACPGIHQLPLP